MKLDTQGDWLLEADRRPSPNQDERPVAVEIALIVVHGISLPPGEFGGPWIDALFQNRLDARAHPYFAGIAHLKVSAHLLIHRDGRVVQYVPFSRRAWHAGQSEFRGRTGCNDFSIGIELEGTDELPYSDMQYTQLAAAITALRTRYPHIDAEAVVGHSDIAPGRKTDPGPSFDWVRLRALLDGRQLA